MRIHLTEDADNDLIEIWDFISIESNSEDIANHVIGSINITMNMLTRFPMAGRSRERDLKNQMRSIVSGNYLIFYRVLDEIILVLRILHGSRELKKDMFTN